MKKSEDPSKAIVEVELTNLPCGQARESLERFRDGDLPPPEATAVQAHLSVCPACAARLSDAATLGALLRLRAEAIGEGLPGGFSDAILAALPGRPRPFGWFFAGRRRNLILGAVALAAVAAAVALPLVGGRMRRSAAVRLRAAEDEAHLRGAAIRRPEAKPVVFENDLGQTVVWVAPDAPSPRQQGDKR